MNARTLIDRPIHIIGAGGIGVVLGWCLKSAGESVSVIEINRKKIDAGKNNGLIIEGRTPMMPEFIHYNDWQPQADTLILLCTKTYNNGEILKRISVPAMLLPVQNGFDPLLDSSGHGGEGIVSFVSECEPQVPRTRITRQGEFHIGPRDNNTEVDTTCLPLIAGALNKAGLFSVHYVDNINPYKYSKLMYNAAISPLAASAGIDNSELLNQPLAKKLFIALLKENYAILQHAGIKLEKIGPMHPDLVHKILHFRPVVEMMAIFFKPSLRGTYCSMAADILTDNTEIDAYNGHLVHLAGNFPCPLNRAAINMVKNIVKNRLPTGMDHLISLEASLPKGVLT